MKQELAGSESFAESKVPGSLNGKVKTSTLAFSRHFFK